MSDRAVLIHTRGGLVVASVSQGVAIDGAAVLIIESATGGRVPGRIASTVGSDVPACDRALRVVEVLYVDPAGTIRLGDVAMDADSPGGHEWGALGLPLGAETRLSSTMPAETDVGVALASAGHRLTVETPRHDVMPGDEIHVGGDRLLVLAIDRRNDVMTLRDGLGEERGVPFGQTMREAR